MIPTTPTRDAVRERYAAAARSHLTGDASPCCNGSRSGGEPDPITVGLYERTDSPSDAALAASLGCGNPTALADLVEHAVDLMPERVALLDAHRERSYAQLEQRANQLAHYLQEQGVRPGDKVASYRMIAHALRGLA